MNREDRRKNKTISDPFYDDTKKYFSGKTEELETIIHFIDKVLALQAPLVKEYLTLEIMCKREGQREVLAYLKTLISKSQIIT